MTISHLKVRPLCLRSLLKISLLLLVCQKPLLGQETHTVFQRSLPRADGEGRQLLSVPLDSHAYRYSTSKLSDLRVLDSEGRDVAYRIRRQARSETQVFRDSWDAKNLRLEPSSTEGLKVDFTLGQDDPQPDGLTILTPLSNFEQTVRVYTLDQGQETLLFDKGVLFDYSQFMNVRRTEVRLPKTTSREFRLVIQSPVDEAESAVMELTRRFGPDGSVSREERLSILRRPFRISSIQLWKEEERILAGQPLTVPYPVELLESNTDSDRKETVLRFRTQREPLQKLTVVTDDQNFSRDARVRIRSEKDKPGRQIGSGTLTRINFQSIQEESLSIPVTGSRDDTDYELVIENRDSSPLQIREIQGTGYVDEIVFLAEAGQTYTLRYSGRDQEAPDYDTSAIDLLLSKGTPVVAVLPGEPEAVDAPIVHKPLKFMDILNNRWFLGPLIIVLVILLGAGLYGAARKIDTLSSNDSENSA